MTFRLKSGFCTLVLLLAGFSFVSAGEKLTLTAGGKTDYQILLPESPTQVQTAAAEELAGILKEISGADFPIIREDGTVAKPEEKLLVIGPSRTSQKFLNGDPDESSIGYDGIIIKQAGESIVFSGHPQRGPLYAVDTFLEDELGCRWWTSAESFIPKCADITADDFDLCYTPKLIFRDSFYEGVIGEDHVQFASRIKCNGNAEPIPEKWGGHHHYLYFVHSFYQIINPMEYEEHPDWFPEIDGVRKVGCAWAGTPEYREWAKHLKPEQIAEQGAQLCLSNEELYQTMLARILDGLKKDPTATIVSISQNDWGGYCECEKCRKVLEEEGTISGVILRFVNRMAEDIQRVYPDVLIDTLAYRDTRKPPLSVSARENVIVRLCSIECSFIQDLQSWYGEPLSRSGERRPAVEEQNLSFQADIEEWNKHAEHLFIWDYMTDFSAYLLPFPNYRIWADNIRFFTEHRTLGLFEQGDYQAATGDFVQLRAWVVAKLLWNPELSQRELMEEFIAGYYAPELVPLYMEYFDLLADAYEKTGMGLDIYRKSAKDWIDLDTMNRAKEILNECFAIAERLERENPEKYANLVYKVRRESIPHDLVLISDYAAFTEEARLSGKEFIAPKPEEMKAFAEDFCTRLDKAGVKVYAEFSSPEMLDEYKEKIRALGADPLAVPDDETAK